MSRPGQCTPDDVVVEGEVERGKRYEEKDFNRIIEIRKREEYCVRLFMQQINQSEKTLVFCATQDHAAAVRDLINQMKTDNVNLILVEPYFDLKTPNSIARETGSKVVVLPPSVGGAPAAKDYIGLFDHLVGLMSAALGGR